MEVPGHPPVFTLTRLVCGPTAACRSERGPSAPLHRGCAQDDRESARPWRPAADGKNGESCILPWQRHRELHFGRVEVLANRLPFGKIAGFYILSWQKPRFLHRLRCGVAKAIREPQVRGSSLPRFSGVSRWTSVKHAGFAKGARQRGAWRGLFGDDERTGTTSMRESGGVPSSCGVPPARRDAEAKGRRGVSLEGPCVCHVCDLRLC